MAQFDVHRNLGANKAAIPFVVIVQSSQFDRYRRRVVVPLMRKSALFMSTPTVGSRKNPVFKVQAIEVVLNPLDLASVAIDNLGAKAGTLAQHKNKIVDALDEMLTCSWG